MWNVTTSSGTPPGLRHSIENEQTENDQYQENAIKGRDFGPLQGQWAGTFSHGGDSHRWQVLIQQYGETSGQFEGSHVTTLPDSTTVDSVAMKSSISALTL